MKKNLKEFKNLGSYIKEERKKIIFATFLVILGSIIGVSYGYLNGAALEALIDLNFKKGMIYLAIYFVTGLLDDAFISEICMKTFAKIEVRLSSKINEKAYEKVLNLPAYAFERKTSGELINRLTNDTEVLSSTFGDLLMMVVSIFNSFIVLIYIFYNSLIVGSAVVIIIIMMIIVNSYFSPKIKTNNEQSKTVNDHYTTNVTESIRGIREIKTLGIKSNMFFEIQKTLKDYIKRRDIEIDLNEKFAIIIETLKIILEIGVFIVCGILLYYKHINITFFIAMTYYIYRYTRIVSDFTNVNKKYQKVLVSITRVNEILENKLFTDETFGTKDIDVCFGNIELANVNFAYNKNEKVLNDINVNFKPNQKIALVGKSGQGKTTIFNLLTKIYNPDSGDIYLDGINLKEISEESLRNHISIIRQDTYIFNRTIKENFKMVDPKIPLKEIRKYTKLAYLDDYIMSLPKKYDTLLGEGGTNLSGGQKQRLAIARALAKKSKVLLLDEATSALDNESQAYIQKTIDELVKNHTVIIVAHRLSTIIDSDIIYVVDEGRIVESGSHDSLIKNSKTYQSLYNTEFN